MVQGIGSDGFDIDLAQTADVTAYVTADGVCVDAAELMLFGDDLSIPLASAQDFRLLMAAAKVSHSRTCRQHSTC